eukprot:scaffold171727_cov40-Tisochrysis_lutea.AAC.1
MAQARRLLWTPVACEGVVLHPHLQDNGIMRLSRGIMAGGLLVTIRLPRSTSTTSTDHEDVRCSLARYRKAHSSPASRARRPLVSRPQTPTCRQQSAMRRQPVRTHAVRARGSRQCATRRACPTADSLPRQAHAQHNRTPESQRAPPLHLGARGVALAASRPSACPRHTAGRARAQ